MSIDYRKERYILNNYARFLTEGTSFVTANDISTELFQKIEVAEKGLYQQLIDSERQITACSNYSIYVGTTGIAMLYLYKYMKNNDSSALTRGKRIVAEANEKGKYTGISFLRGNAGPLALGFIFNAFASGGSSATELSRRLCALADKDVDSPCELLNGRAGYLYALLFVQKYFNNVISEELLRKQISIILREGVRRAEITPCEAPLVYEWYDTNYLGAAHGLAGILYILLCCSRLLTSKEKNDLIQPTIEWLLTQRFPSGNFKPSTDKDEDNLVQWCHGAPGFVHLFTLASEVFKSRKYLDVALQCGEIVWERGLLSKGYSLCHGVSGNAYTFLELFKYTKNAKHLHRAACFAEWCTHHPRDQHMKPDRPLSLFEGLAGLIYFLNDIRKPNAASFPGYGL
nr:lanC-like protein 2 [Halyomorpha halys]